MLKGQKLKDQLLAFQQAGAPHLANTNMRTAVQQIRGALQAAINSYENGEWVITTHSDTEECSDNDDGDEWEDM